MVRPNTRTLLAFLLLSFSSLSVLAQDLDGSGTFTGSGDGAGTAEGAVAPGSGQPGDIDDEDSWTTKVTSTTTRAAPLPIDDEDGSIDRLVGSGVDIDGAETQPTTRSVSDTTPTTSSTSTTTSPTTSSTSPTTSRTTKPTRAPVTVNDIDVDGSDDDEEIAGSGRSSTEEPPTSSSRAPGPCELRRAERLDSNKDFRHKCTSDGYYSEIKCTDGECKCVDRETGKKNRELTYFKDTRRCGVPYEVEKPIEKDDEDDDDDDEDRKIGDEKEETDGDGSLLTNNPGLFAGIIGGAVVGLLILILLVMFIVYRMRKKDEGSYALDNQKKPAAHPYQKCPQEYYA